MGAWEAAPLPEGGRHVVQRPWPCALGRDLVGPCGGACDGGHAGTSSHPGELNHVIDVSRALAFFFVPSAVLRLAMAWIFFTLAVHGINHLIWSMTTQSDSSARNYPCRLHGGGMDFFQSTGGEESRLA